MELQNPDYEELKADLTVIDGIETFKLPKIVPQPTQVEATTWTPEARDAWRAKYRGDNLSGMALKAITYDEIINRK